LVSGLTEAVDSDSDSEVSVTISGGVFEFAVAFRLDGKRFLREENTIMGWLFECSATPEVAMGLGNRLYPE
jgi:hypothetical protein